MKHRLYCCHANVSEERWDGGRGGGRERGKILVLSEGPWGSKASWRGNHAES